MSNRSRVDGWWVFAGILLTIAGLLNIAWGIAAIGDSRFFADDAHFIVANLETWGWISVIVGVVELIASFSLFSGGGFGRWVGIVAAATASISSMLSVSAYPLWSVCIFALSIIIIHQLARGATAG